MFFFSLGAQFNLGLLSEIIIPALATYCAAKVKKIALPGTLAADWGKLASSLY